MEVIIAVFILYYSASSNADNHDWQALKRRQLNPILSYPFVAPSLYQTLPSCGVAVCLNSTVEFTCIGETELQFRDVDETVGVTYDTVSTRRAQQECSEQC